MLHIASTVLDRVGWRIPEISNSYPSEYYSRNLQIDLFPRGSLTTIFFI